MSIQNEIGKIEAECLADKKWHYLTNFALDIEESNPTIWALILPVACRIYPAFTVQEGRATDLLSVLEKARRADPQADVSAAMKLLMADAEVPVEATDGTATWQSYTFLASLAGCALKCLKDQALHDSLIARAVELADSPWGKNEGLVQLLESAKITSAQTDRLVDLSKKHLKGSKLKTLLQVVERRRKYGEIE